MRCFISASDPEPMLCKAISTVLGSALELFVIQSESNAIKTILCDTILFLPFCNWIETALKRTHVYCSHRLPQPAMGVCRTLLVVS